MTSIEPLRGVLTMPTMDGIRCDTLFTREDADQIVGTLFAFAEIKRDDPRILKELHIQELDAVVPYGPN